MQTAGRAASLQHRPAANSGSGQIDVEDRHREIVVAVILVLEDDAEEFVADIDSAESSLRGRAFTWSLGFWKTRLK
ncbi:hypothetical protein AJ88_33620 [Mesorhizobium amorphae CCBAU 01583]|nr:hypothetical protein AJ88_33620 [Mesorhizobium amorphae CCBAU 01583]